MICKSLMEKPNSICADQNWLSNACKIFPVQLMKVVRLELSRAAKLLVK